MKKGCVNMKMSAFPVLSSQTNTAQEKTTEFLPNFITSFCFGLIPKGEQQVSTE